MEETGMGGKRREKTLSRDNLIFLKAAAVNLFCSFPKDLIYRCQTKLGQETAGTVA